MCYNYPANNLQDQADNKICSGTLSQLIQCALGVSTHQDDTLYYVSGYVGDRLFCKVEEGQLGNGQWGRQAFTGP